MRILAVLLAALARLSVAWAQDDNSALAPPPPLMSSPVVVPPPPPLTAAPAPPPLPAAGLAPAAPPPGLGQTAAPAAGLAPPANPPAPAQPAPPDTPPVIANTWNPGTTAMLGVLDKVDGTTTQVAIPVGGEQTIGDLQVSVQACLVRPADQLPDAAIFLSAQNMTDGSTAPLYRGWLVRSMPAATVVGDASEVFRVIGCS